MATSIARWARCAPPVIQLANNAELHMKHLLVALLSGLVSLSSTVVLAAKHEKSAAVPIAIIGTGEVGSALGESWGRLGHPIIYGSRSPDSDKTKSLVSRSGDARAVPTADAAGFADIVVLALPFTAALELLPRLEGLDGKILIDPMNALTFDRERGLVYQSDQRLAEQLQKLAPGAHVVKALNAVTARNMDPQRRFDGPISIPVAGDDDNAKRVVIGLIAELRLHAQDVGPLFNARFVEEMAPLYVYMNVFARPPGGFEFSFSRSGADE
jgi:predicted dinucleotide-binding enzyme